MGTTYRHLSTADLIALRDRLVASLTDRLTGPTSIGSSGRQVQFQQSVADLRQEIEAVNAELARRGEAVDATGDPAPSRGPIYLV